MHRQLYQFLILPILIFFLFSMNTLAQAPVQYEKEWKKVEDLVKKNLPKSALAEVKKIYDLAKKDKQDAQIIKALVYMTGLQNETREDSEILSIKEIEKEMAGAKEPATSILKSLLAEMYWNYFQNRRWQLYDRTKTVDFKKEDVATWDAEDFHKKIKELYLQSIKEEKLLQQTKLQPFDAIIVKGNVRHLRPTLYDLLAHRAVDYFDNDERDIKRPDYAFEINQSSAFDPAADFIHHKFTTRDTFSLQHKALLVFQKLIAFHLNDAKPDALIDADIKRIEFVNRRSTHPDKDNLYFNAISHIARQYENHPAAAQAWYLMAAFFDQKANTYKPFGDTTQRYARVKAKEICEKILMQKDSSEGRVNAYNLLNQINSRSLQFSMEKVNVPGQPFRVLVKYRNFTTLYLRLIKPNEALKKELENQYGDKYWTSIIAAKPERSWEQTLPATHDYQQHALEIKVNALPPGEYLLVAATDKDFNDKKTILGARYFYVSNISYINSSNDYFILNRDNGRPLAKATVQVWERKYDAKTYKYIKEKGKQYQTDENGFIKIPADDKNSTRYTNYSYYLDITHNGDKLFLDEMQYDYYYNRDGANREEKSITSVFLFADRSIYRPAQTIYFKGIVLSRRAKEKTGVVNSGYETKVYLRNANYQDIDSVSLTTNEYGSFSGNFRLPQTGLTGQFSIYTDEDDGHVDFRVEEYKRPKFYVDFEPVKGTYKVNDSIKVTGIAKAYAGNNIDGATVKYRVVRQPRFIYPWISWRWWVPPVKEMEIANGEIKTDKDGKFEIRFLAIPDLTVDKNLEPVFDYKIITDVTDINGETRSGEKIVSVSYKALLLKTRIPSSLPADSLKSLFIRTENMNGEFEPAIVNVTITKLKEEKRLIRNRYWERPDQFVMSKEEYIKLFPYDEYDNESDLRSWEKGEIVLEKSDSVREGSEFGVRSRKFGVGFYMVEISAKDKNGEEVKDVQYIELFDERNKQLLKPAYLWSQGSKPIEPGEKTDITIGTSAESVFVIQQIDRKPGIGSQETGVSDFRFFGLNNEKKSFDFTATESDRGGYGVTYFFVKNNRFFQFGDVIKVPWTNKDLKIEYATFRDKTLPGSEEKWKIKISGYKKELVAAEMLASMYDASLDQFYHHAWGKPGVWPAYSSRKVWNGSLNFSKYESISNNNEFDIEDEYHYKEYDKLITPDETLHYVVELKFTNAQVVSNVEVLRQSGVKDEGISYLTISKKNDNDLDGKDDNFDTVKREQQSPDIQIRKNFNETAFFFPDLKTDSIGAIEFSFTMPEALTRWKFQALAHTKELAFGYSSKEIVTQKELMVQPNVPRFLREGDKMEFNTKIVNLTENELTGQVQLQLFDATTNQSVDGWFHNVFPNQYFTVAAGQSEAVKFPVEIPYSFSQALVWRIVAKAGDFSDGEENSMPVLTNRMLVTETLPLNIRGSGTRQFTFDKLLKSGASETLANHSLTVEFTGNPAWYAVQALPYLMEYPYDCAEQVWNRYYANSLASMIANSSPRIKQIFEQWKIKDTAALLSNLQKNEELKSVLLEETPWVLQAKNETEQKKNIALLFDMIKMSEQLNSSLEKLKQMQLSNGGFVWFKGGPDDRYMTQYIITGIGHLKKLNAFAPGQENNLKQILATAIPYLDKKIKADHDDLKKNKTDLKKYSPGYTVIQYLYMRSFFPEYAIDKNSLTAYNYFRSRLPLTWTSQSKYMQGMMALALHRTGDAKTPAAILKSLKETSITHEELGMYWKNVSGGWFWYQAPIETQALLIEAFAEISKDTKTVDDLKTWLLKNKQTNNWKTTKATAEACYALLLQGTNWLVNEPSVEIKLGDTPLSTGGEVEAGTGYFKKIIEGRKVQPGMGNISVTVTPAPLSTSGEGTGLSWGAMYWQYFEDLDKITTASTPLKLEKKLFVERNTDRGPVLIPLSSGEGAGGEVLKVGDKIKVRIELRVDRDMEYVHMKDMRASALEPVNVLSSYKWQGGLGYYESTRDASTNFFFSYLRKGTYVFEYPVFVTHSGNFSNGVTTIQCMYAPEFTSHSEGIRIKVE
jgi:hypothetical protein